jgi:hypothetical protein
MFYMVTIFCQEIQLKHTLEKVCVCVCVCYLTMLSMLKLYSVDRRQKNEYGAMVE